MKYTNFQKISPKETREKWARVFFVCMFVTSCNFETTTHACVSMALWRHWRVWEGEESCNLVCSIFKLFSWTLPHVFWRWKFRIRNSCPMDKMSSILQWRLLKFDCFLLCFQAAAFWYFLFSKCHFVLRASSSDDLTGRGVTSRLISLFSLFISLLLCLLHKQRQGLQICVVIYHLHLPRSMIVAIEQITWNQHLWLKLLHASYIFFF